MSKSVKDERSYASFFEKKIVLAHFLVKALLLKKACTGCYKRKE